MRHACTLTTASLGDHSVLMVRRIGRKSRCDDRLAVRPQSAAVGCRPRWARNGGGIGQCRRPVRVAVVRASGDVDDAIAADQQQGRALRDGFLRRNAQQQLLAPVKCLRGYVAHPNLQIWAEALPVNFNQSATLSLEPVHDRNRRDGRRAGSRAPIEAIMDAICVGARAT